ncbi:MAG TPA: DUF1307 domain-containing protein [Candidatus Ligilactobacillus excrementavium]|nr:DUF1307 domain-containing protein [Candidatus Ligilactobacillus excrementavium]
MKEKNVSLKFTKILLVAAMMLLIIAGCGKKTEKATFQQVKNGVDSRVTYYYQDDKVVKQTTDNKITYASLKANNKDEAKDQIKSEVQKYNDTKGVKDEIKYHDSYLKEKVSVDLKEASVDDFLKLSDQTTSADSGKKKKYISFEKSEDLIKKQGFKKIKDGKYKQLPKAELQVKKPLTMKQYNEIAVAKSGKEAKKGTTVDELKDKLGKADRSSDTSYTWYTNYTETNYFRVTVNDQDEVQSKFLLQPTVKNNKFSPEKYDKINDEISEDELIEKLGEPYQAQTYSDRGVIYYVTKDDAGQKIQTEFGFQVEDGKVT